MAYENILFEVSGGIATVTLNRNETRNALSGAMAMEISDALDRLDDARVLVITGAGKAFCSGGDMGSAVPEGLSMGDVLANCLFHEVNPVMAKISQLDIPVIAAVNGAAAGAGAPLALVADFVIAAESAIFYLAFANVGLVPDAGSSWILPRLIGSARAMQMMMLADKIPARQAEEWGMIYKAVPDEAFKAEADALAQRLVNGPTVSYGLIRKNLRAALDSDFETALRIEAQAQRISGATEDCREAVAAFLQKRPPVFKGK